MNNSIANNSNKFVIVFCAVTLCVLSVYVHQLREFDWYRFLRGMVSFTALAVLLFYSRKRTNPLKVWFLLVYGLSSIATIWYENANLATIAMILNFCAILFLVRAIYPKVSFKNMSWWLILIFIVLVLFNAFLLYKFIAMLKYYAESTVHYLFMLFGAMSMVVLGFLALVYNFQHSSKSSLVLVISVFSIIFSEVFRGIAYYDFAFGDTAVYMARALLIIGNFLLVHFCLLEKSQVEKLNRKLL